jgi:hypothetical protein
MGAINQRIDETKQPFQAISGECSCPTVTFICMSGISTLVRSTTMVSPMLVKGD